MQITLPNGMPFVFRGKLDKGVVSHFYNEGYFINDNEKPIKTIIDAGANIGDESARFLIHHPSATIVAVEAADCNFLLLEKNFTNVTNIVPIKGALWPVSTHLKLIPGRSMESFSIIEASHNIESVVPAWTIPDLMNKMKWDEVDILKLDIEGSEYELFTRNFQEWINKVNCFIFEVPDNDKPGSTQAIFHALEGQSYNSYICGENLVIIRSELPWILNKVIGFNQRRKG